MTPAPREGMPSVPRWIVQGYRASGGFCVTQRVQDAEGGWVMYTDHATALLSEADAARAKALEEAAKVCDAQAERWVDFPAEHHRMETYIAAAHRIRALAAQDRAKETKNG